MIDATQGIQVVQQFSRDNQKRDRHILVKWTFGQSFSVRKSTEFLESRQMVQVLIYSSQDEKIILHRI